MTSMYKLKKTDTRLLAHMVLWLAFTYWIQYTDFCF